MAPLAHAVGRGQHKMLQLQDTPFCRYKMVPSFTLDKGLKSGHIINPHNFQENQNITMNPSRRPWNSSLPGINNT